MLIFTFVLKEKRGWYLCVRVCACVFVYLCKYDWRRKTLLCPGDSLHGAQGLVSTKVAYMTAFTSKDSLETESLRHIQGFLF